MSKLKAKRSRLLFLCNPSEPNVVRKLLALLSPLKKWLLQGKLHLNIKIIYILIFFFLLSDLVVSWNTADSFPAKHREKWKAQKVNDFLEMQQRTCRGRSESHRVRLLPACSDHSRSTDLCGSVINSIQITLSALKKKRKKKEALNW